jgi:hypothetical protein
MNPVISEELALPQQCVVFLFLPQLLFLPKRNFVCILLFIGWLADCWLASFAGFFLIMLTYFFTKSFWKDFKACTLL